MDSTDAAEDLRDVFRIPAMRWAPPRTLSGGLARAWERAASPVDLIWLYWAAGLVPSEHARDAAAEVLSIALDQAQGTAGLSSLGEVKRLAARAVEAGRTTGLRAPVLEGARAWAEAARRRLARSRACGRSAGTSEAIGELVKALAGLMLENPIEAAAVASACGGRAVWAAGLDRGSADGRGVAAYSAAAVLRLREALGSPFAGLDEAEEQRLVSRVVAVKEDLVDHAGAGLIGAAPVGAALAVS